MNVDRGQLIHGEALPVSTRGDDEIERDVSRFRAALALARTDRAEAARIDALVAELDADEFLYEEAIVTLQKLRPRRNRSRRFQLKLPGSKAAAILAYGGWESGTYSDEQEWPRLKKKNEKLGH